MKTHCHQFFSQKYSRFIYQVPPESPKPREGQETEQVRIEKQFDAQVRKKGQLVEELMGKSFAGLLGFPGQQKRFEDLKKAPLPSKDAPGLQKLETLNEQLIQMRGVYLTILARRPEYPGDKRNLIQGTNLSWLSTEEIKVLLGGEAPLGLKATFKWLGNNDLRNKFLEGMMSKYKSLYNRKAPVLTTKQVKEFRDKDPAVASQELSAKHQKLKDDAETEEHMSTEKILDGLDK